MKTIIMKINLPHVSLLKRLIAGTGLLLFGVVSNSGAATPTYQNSQMRYNATGGAVPVSRWSVSGVAGIGGGQYQQFQSSQPQHQHHMPLGPESSNAQADPKRE